MHVFQSGCYASYMERVGFGVHQAGDVYGYYKRIPFIHAGVMKVLRVPGHALTFQVMDKLLSVVNAGKMYVEPLDDLPSYIRHTYRLIPNRSPYLPLTTLRHPLSLNYHERVSMMSRTRRYQLRHSARQGLIAHISSGSQVLSNKHLYADVYGLLEENATYGNYFVLPKSWFASILESFLDDMFVVTVYAQHQLIGVCVCLCSTTEAYYWASGLTHLGRTLNAGTLAVVAAMNEASVRELCTFDFGGIFDHRNSRTGWLGFSRFKNTFGGEKYYYPMPLALTIY